MDLLTDLAHIFSTDRLRLRHIDRYAYAGDASHFFLLPKAVVLVETEAEVQALFACAQRHGVPVTFRAGGTSLSGQAVTNGILADLSRFWRGVWPVSDGLQVRLQPGVIGSYVNTALRPFGRKMGPDPASITAAMMGGILSNNSSGMCCGVRHNAYHTLAAMRFILPNGQIFDTHNPADYDRFRSEATSLYMGLSELRQQILHHPTLAERIRAKYQQKNTTGYSLNAFLDYEHPLDIFAHLLIGAEGTLAFIAEATLHTLPDLPYKTTGMLWFPSTQAACEAIFPLRETGAEALEFMDRRALESVENMSGVPHFVKNLPDGAAAILCEYQADTEMGLVEKYAQAQPVLESLTLLQPATFTRDAAEQALFWKIRKGMYPSVASVRAKGTATMLEDLTFPVEKLAAAITDVQDLFQQYGYRDAIIFGHAKDGNLHFCISQSFANEAEIERFEAFNDDLFRLVIDKYDGALKAEHGTGRAVAPYVEAEWGPEAYQIMRTLKQLADPEGLLNPDVILTADTKLHLRNLKVMPVVEGEVDKCVECGYCERRCPSRDYTMTPRQRIAVRRALKRLETAGDYKSRAEILHDFQFDGMDTCAVDGMCATDCPVGINTGELIKRLRREQHDPVAQRFALRLAHNFRSVENIAKVGVSAGHLLGDDLMKQLTAFIRKAVPDFPLWANSTGQPRWHLGNSSKYTIPASLNTVLYFGSCISRMMDNQVFQTFEQVCNRAGYGVALVPSGSCCGQIFGSKGFSDAQAYTANQTVEMLWERSLQGQHPIVLDVTSCTYTLQHSAPYLSAENKAKFAQLRLLDSIEFAQHHLLPRLQIVRPKRNIVFHPVCSAYKMGLLEALQTIGNACAERATLPTFAGCCGMAGDRGFYYPHLIQAATAVEAAEVNQQIYDGYYTSAKPCAMALSAGTGHTYGSLWDLLEAVTKA